MCTNLIMTKLNNHTDKMLHSIQRLVKLNQQKQCLQCRIYKEAMQNIYIHRYIILVATGTDDDSTVFT